VSELDTPDEAGGDPATTGDPYDSTEELGPEGERVARVVTQRLTRSTLYMGPIPSGEMLESYNAALGQGGAGRVLALAEAQSEHRRHRGGWSNLRSISSGEGRRTALSWR
jgi:Predicted membrane protein (DUF2335)